ncbi:MAG: hypothetical protein M1812_005055 [Candelaria pacifica]|nr:MAG: hypothetical protein M1812_005055 [Candelaria pacifica]
MRFTAARVHLVQVEVPTEILFVIFGVLAKKDIKNVRLVCKEFDAVACHYLVDHVFISPLRGNLDIFVHVMRHPIFSKTVRKIIWTEHLFQPKTLTLPGWNGWFNYNKPASKDWVTQFPPDTSGSYRNKYLIALQEMDMIKRSGEDNAIFCAGLATMPRVEKVILTDDFGQHRSDLYHPPALCNSSAPLLPQTRWPESLPAAGSSDGQGQNRWICQSFRNLRKIDLFITFHEPEALGTLDLRNLAQAISGAHSLEVLLLSFNKHAPLYEILGSGTWPRLRRFYTCCFSINQHEILDFIKRHAKTLREIHFEFGEVSDGTWESVLETIRSWAIPLCNSFFEDVADGTSDSELTAMSQDVTRYLQHGGQNPLQRPVVP